MLAGYIAIAVLIISFILLSLNNLNELQKMITYGETATDLFDTSLEIRRFEKNYFLYKTEEDYRELNQYIERMSNLLLKSELELFASKVSINDIKQHINAYQMLLTNLSKSNFSTDIEKKIRVHGKVIVSIAEKIDDDRKIIKTRYLNSTMKHLILGSSLLLFAWFVVGIIFYRKTVRTLSLLEDHMKRVSKGELSLIETKFKDRELLSLKAAFNKMLTELQARQELLIQSEKITSMGTMIFGVAHELNNPLSNILSSSQILREEIEGVKTEFMNELLDQLESETERAVNVVSSILDFSRSQIWQKFNLRNTVEETIRLLRADLSSKIEINTDIPDDLFLFADKQKIQQVFINLIKNSADAIDMEGQIRINASLTGDNGELIEIVVLDTGCGMSEKVLANVFDPFYSSKKEKTGFGLGLFIVHSIIEEHNGTISVDSDIDGGTAFTIILPVQGRDND